MACRLTRHLLSVLAALLLAAAAVLHLSPTEATAAETTTLSGQARTEGRTIIVRAVLRDAKAQPLARQPLQIAALGTAVAATTGADGWAEATLPIPDGRPPGRLAIRVSFAGDQKYAASKATVFGSVPMDTSTRLSAAIKKEQSIAQPGDAVEVTGALTGADGTPIVGARITAAIGRSGAPGGVLTDAQGRYRALAQVPLNAGPGAWQVVVRFAGAEGMDPSMARVPITIEAMQTPSTAPISSATPSPSPTPTAEPSEKQSASPIPTTPQPASPAPPAGKEASMTRVILLGTALGALILGGLVLALALAARQRSKPQLEGLIDEVPRVPAPQNLPRNQDLPHRDEPFSPRPREPRQ